MRDDNRRDANAYKSWGKRAPIKFADGLGDVSADVSKRSEDWPSGTWPFLVKRYIESDSALHVHVQFGAVEDAEPCDFCLPFECAIADADLLKSCSGLSWGEVVKACIGDNRGQVDELVPVEVRQTIEDGQRGVFW